MNKYLSGSNVAIQLSDLCVYPNFYMRAPLVKTVIHESPSLWKAQAIIEWLLKHGFIERPERGVYNITEKGRTLLKSHR